MKKFLPFVFPAIALLVVLFLAVRWYNSNTVRTDGKITPFADGVKIEDLTQAELSQMKRGLNNQKVIKLTGADDVMGEVRYEVRDGKVFFTVDANIAELLQGQGFYQVWLKQVNGESKRKAFVLESGKGGYTGSAAISADTLPFEVVVSKETADDDMMEMSLLRGVVPKPEEKN